MSNELQALADEVSGALADLIETVREGGANLSEVSSTLVEMLELLKAAKPGEPAQVNVTVQPAEVVVIRGNRRHRGTFEYDSETGRLTGFDVTSTDEGS